MQKWLKLCSEIVEKTDEKAIEWVRLSQENSAIELELVRLRHAERKAERSVLARCCSKKNGQIPMAFQNRANRNEQTAAEKRPRRRWTERERPR